MPSPLVVDASVVLKRQLEDEEGVPQALALRDDFLLHSRIDLTAPSLLIYELANGILTATHRVASVSCPRPAVRGGTAASVPSCRRRHSGGSARLPWPSVHPRSPLLSQ